MTGDSKPPKDPPVNPNSTGETPDEAEAAPAESEDAQGEDEQ